MNLFQNKEFVYRGQEWEKISTFTQRLASEFPNAQVLTSNSKEPDQSLKSEDGQFIQICCVKPVPGLEDHSYPMDGYDMPEKIRKFHMANNVNQFQYDRPYHKGCKDRDNEFKVKHSFEGYCGCLKAFESKLILKLPHFFTHCVGEGKRR